MEMEDDTGEASTNNKIEVHSSISGMNGDSEDNSKALDVNQSLNDNKSEQGHCGNSTEATTDQVDVPADQSIYTENTESALEQGSAEQADDDDVLDLCEENEEPDKVGTGEGQTGQESCEADKDQPQSEETSVEASEDIPQQDEYTNGSESNPAQDEVSQVNDSSTPQDEASQVNDSSTPHDEVSQVNDSSTPHDEVSQVNDSSTPQSEEVHGSENVPPQDADSANDDDILDLNEGDEGAIGTEIAPAEAPPDAEWTSSNSGEINQEENSLSGVQIEQVTSNNGHDLDQVVEETTGSNEAVDDSTDPADDIIQINIAMETDPEVLSGFSVEESESNKEESSAIDMQEDNLNFDENKKMEETGSPQNDNKTSSQEEDMDTADEIKDAEMIDNEADVTMETMEESKSNEGNDNTGENQNDMESEGTCIKVIQVESIQSVSEPQPEVSMTEIADDKPSTEITDQTQIGTESLNLEPQETESQNDKTESTNDESVDNKEAGKSAGFDPDIIIDTNFQIESNTAKDGAENAGNETNETVTPQVETHDLEAGQKEAVAPEGIQIESVTSEAPVKSEDTSVEKGEAETKADTTKSAEKEAEEVQIVDKPKEEIQVIDLDDDSDTEQKEVKTEAGSELKISSVTGAIDMAAVPDSKKDIKPVPPVKKEHKPDPKFTAKNKVQTCIVCKKVGKCKYNIVRNGDIKHLCDDDCFKKFRSNPTTYLRSDPPPTEPSKVAPLPNKQSGQFKTCQVCQIMNVNAQSSKPFLNWQGMDFCGEDCLGSFHGRLNSSCSHCSATIPQTSKGRFVVKFDENKMNQFCSQNCNTEFLKKQKVCACCQKDISKSPEAFVASAGSDGVFKDFCSQVCLQTFEEKINRGDCEITSVHPARVGGLAPKGVHTCSVCSKVSSMKHVITLEGKHNYLCSDPCFSAFQYANKLTMNSCDNCGVYCYNEGMNPQYIQFEGQQKRFCSFMCVNTFKTLNKKVVTCSWCNSKKSNFDMIERVDANNKYQLFCSLNCLSLYRVNLQATSNQAVVCDQCKRSVPAQYHLTMSDASVRNFCSYSCVMTFQSQFTGAPAVTTVGQNNAAPKTGIQTRSAIRPPTPHRAPQTAIRQSLGHPPRPAVQTRPTNPNMNQIPIISNVVSLAPQGNQQQQINLKSNQQVPLVIGNKNANIRTTVPPQTKQNSAVQVQQTVIIQPPQPKSIKNKSCLCKPFVQTKATSCRPHTQTKETQTDKDKEPHGAIIPIPIPFYVPVPMAMYTQPTPTPFPFPVPIPIPCFIPTTKKNAKSILKQIKEIREKIPDDPLEAELLMMAEAVSAETKESSDSESDHEEEPEPMEDTTTDRVTPRSASPQEKPAELGEDMLQMALRMASEITAEPVMDLEETIAPIPVNTEPPPKPKPIVHDEDDEQDDGDEDYTPLRETRSLRTQGTKRSRTGHSKRRSKRQKAPVVVKVAESPAPEPEPEPVIEPPADANMYLKYTYGVNAWKHWVVQKNSQLEKVSQQGSGKLKLFKTDMLQCSADELNYSLCLFVKEVRKPNGDEYNPDSIYYLCLGIQMYLFESDRIDNIFTDVYYEKFTECLNEVLQRFTPKLNAAGQIVCRIEEEHLWECKQLGAHSPHVLLNTLVYFNTKYFQLKTAEDHLKLSFTHIMKHWKKTPVTKGNTQGRSVYLRYYCPAPARAGTDNSKKKKEELPVYEQAENLDNPLRCPVKLYEFYLSKCPESIKNRSDAFYLIPERSCVPDSPVWYSTQNLQIEAMNKMLNRTFLVREIQESFIHTQPIYT